MTPLAAGFWILVAAIVYAHVGYPAVMALLARFAGRAPRREPGWLRPVSIVLCVHDEEANVARRAHELAQLARSSGVGGEVVVVSDGSTDETVRRIHELNDPDVRVVELLENVGKARALGEGVRVARNDILVFADARQSWADDAVVRLVESFCDESVGGVSGELMLESAPGAMAGVGLYWRFERWLRGKEARVHSTVGVTGAICAVRRSLFRAPPPGTILDDVYWPMSVVLQGARVLHDDRARAFDRLPESAGAEFRRKVRTLAGNYQLVARLPALLAPWKNPLFFQFVSHKLMRLFVPWGLVALLAISAILPGTFYRAALGVQLAAYALAAAGSLRFVASRSKLASIANSFVVLNAAAWLGFWVWALGRTGSVWNRTRYRSPTSGDADARTSKFTLARRAP
jgi:poly-beta-1,6-N-acetyl-D-glucosamine synthase